MGRRESDGEYRRSHLFCYSGFGLICTLLGLVAICVSFTTDHWLHYDVNRDAIKYSDPTEFGYTQQQFNRLINEDSKFFSRQRGMLRTCYCDNATWVFKEANFDDVDENCLREIAYDFEDVKIEGMNLTTYEEDVIDLSRNLMRCHLAFFILAIVVLAIAVISSTVGCWCKATVAFIVACACCGIGTLGLLLAMVFFHWYKYMEESEMDFDFYGRKSWHQEPILDDNTKVKYHYSYALGWIAFALTCIAFIFFCLAAWSTYRKKEQESAGLVNSHQDPAVVAVPQGQDDGTVYVINHYGTDEKATMPPGQNQYMSHQNPASLQAYPTMQSTYGHTVYQSAVPRGETMSM